MGSHNKIKFSIFFLFILSIFSCAPQYITERGILEFRKTIREVEETPHLRDATISIKIVSLSSGRTIYDSNSRKMLVPASNLKIITTFSALAILGPEYRFKTEIYIGRDSTLYIKGYGDPTMGISSLWEFARFIMRTGVRSVGDIVADESYFDTLRIGEGWMWEDVKYLYSPPLGALVFAEDRYKYVDDPALAVAYWMKDILKFSGISVKGDIKKGEVSEDSRLLYTIESPPLSEILIDMNKKSSNFIAEQVLKALGAESKGPPGTARKGISVIKNLLFERGVDTLYIHMVDGSGLSRYNLTTADLILKVLSTAFRDSSLKWEFLSSLPIAGVDGTLQDRMDNISYLRAVRAKTGTMRKISSISGFAFKKGDIVAFSILVNNFLGEADDVKNLQDRIIEGILNL